MAAKRRVEGDWGGGVGGAEVHVTSSRVYYLAVSNSVHLVKWQPLKSDFHSKHTGV